MFVHVHEEVKVLVIVVVHIVVLPGGSAGTCAVDTLHDSKLWLHEKLWPYLVRKFFGNTLETLLENLE